MLQVAVHDDAGGVARVAEALDDGAAEAALGAVAMDQPHGQL